MRRLRRRLLDVGGLAVSVWRIEDAYITRELYLPAVQRYARRQNNNITFNKSRGFDMLNIELHALLHVLGIVPRGFGMACRRVSRIGAAVAD